jgi:cytochrome c oxidase assembly protein subunit 11
LNAPDDGLARRNRRFALGAAAFGAGMLALAYAAVPFYSAFCRLTGYAGTPQITKADAGAEGRRTLRVAFDTNVAPGLDWSFEPETDAVTVRTGQTATVFFRARNLSDKPTAANATFNVTPQVSGAWFDKIQCFCFSEQRLEAGGVLSRSEARDGRVDGQGRFDHAVLHAVRRARRPGVEPQSDRTSRPGRLTRGANDD